MATLRETRGVSNDNNDDQKISTLCSTWHCGSDQHTYLGAGFDGVFLWQTCCGSAWPGGLSDTHRRGTSDLGRIARGAA